MITGVIAGRFQVFHNGHLRYLREALEYCEHIIIGITNPDPANITESSEAPHRSEVKSNPLTYYERLRMIQAICEDENIPREVYDIVPFPIDVPENIKYYIPNDALIMVTIHDKWSLEKKRRIEEQGYQVKVIIDEFGIEKISSTMIRDLIARDQGYSEYIPRAAYCFICDNLLDKKIANAVCYQDQ